MKNLHANILRKELNLADSKRRTRGQFFDIELMTKDNRSYTLRGDERGDGTVNHMTIEVTEELVLNPENKLIYLRRNPLSSNELIDRMRDFMQNN